MSHESTAASGAAAPCTQQVRAHAVAWCAEPAPYASKRWRPRMPPHALHAPACVACVVTLVSHAPVCAATADASGNELAHAPPRGMRVRESCVVLYAASRQKTVFCSPAASRQKKNTFSLRRLAKPCGARCMPACVVCDAWLPVARPMYSRTAHAAQRGHCRTLSGRRRRREMCLLAKVRTNERLPIVHSQVQAFVCLFVCLIGCLFVCLFVRLFVCLAAWFGARFSPVPSLASLPSCQWNR